MSIFVDRYESYEENCYLLKDVGPQGYLEIVEKWRFDVRSYSTGTSGNFFSRSVAINVDAIKM